MSITEFLLARIAEDEREANICLDRYRSGDGGSKRRWTRQLAECAAKRCIVEEARDYSPELEYGDNGEWALDMALRALAAVYAEHPDYDEAWRT